MSDKIYMLNALWFKEDGGAEKYAEYVAAAAPFVEELGGKVVLEGYSAEAGIIGEWDPDLFFVVEYPSWETFLKLPAHPGYQKIAHLREEALKDSLLIRCRRQALSLLK